MSDEQQLIKVREDMASWREVDGETIVLQLGQSMYLGINGSGTVLWPAMVTGATRSALQALLIETFSIDSAQAEADVDSFIDSCRERDLLEP